MWNNQQEARDAGYQTLYDTARTCMWSRLGPADERQYRVGYSSSFQPNEDDYEKAKEKLGMTYEKSPGFATNIPDVQYITVPSINQFGQLSVNTYSATLWANPVIPAAQQEKETTMSANYNESRHYADKRIHEIFYSKSRELDEKYADPRPKTIKEMKSWIKEGNFRWKNLPKDENEEKSYNLNHYFTWGKEEPDMKAKQKTYEKLSKAYTEATDIISICSDEDKMLKAVQDFESFSIN